MDGCALGCVEVTDSMTLSQSRVAIAADELRGVPTSYRFLLDGGPVSAPQEHRWRAAECLPAIAILPSEADDARIQVSWSNFLEFSKRLSADHLDQPEPPQTDSIKESPVGPAATRHSTAQAQKFDISADDLDDAE